MDDWKEALESLRRESDSSKKIEILDSLKPFVGEDEVRKEVINLLLNSDDRLIRIKATEVLEELNPAKEDAIEALMKSLLEDEDSFVRGFSAKALGKLGDVRAIEVLKKAQGDSDGFVKHYASEALKVLEMRARFLALIQKTKG
ncbi:MAG: HEAT repeat domain-containing protein [Synergistetes bacterium]|nr:HEAT repeat domain-containing protein [Synergistota bacterium]